MTQLLDKWLVVIFPFLLTLGTTSGLEAGEDGDAHGSIYRTLMVTFDDNCDSSESTSQALRRSLGVSLQQRRSRGSSSEEIGTDDAPVAMQVVATRIASYEAYETTQFDVSLPPEEESAGAGLAVPSRCVVSDETLNRVGVDIIKLTDCPLLQGGELKLAFEQDPCVTSVEFDQLVKIIDEQDEFLGRTDAHQLPNVTAAEDEGSGGPGRPLEEPYWRTIAGFDDAYPLAECLSSEVVAVIDTGVAYNHPLLRKNIWRNPGEIPGNGIDDDDNGFVDDAYGFNFVDNDGDISDDNGHGTHCAGIIGGLKDSETGAQGVCGTTSIAGLKFMGGNGSGATSDAVKAVNYCIHMGIRISNNSWGGPGRTDALEKAVRKSNQAGHIFIAAAGNAGQNIDRSPSYPASYSSPNIVAVAATDSADNMASFSNTGGRTVHVAAPGVAVLSTYPPDGFKKLSGTSMASPVVAGLAALLVSLPFENHLQIKKAIIEGVDKVPACRGKVISGGRVNAANSILWLAGQLGLRSSQLKHRKTELLESGDEAKKHSESETKG